MVLSNFPIWYGFSGCCGSFASTLCWRRSAVAEFTGNSCFASYVVPSLRWEFTSLADLRRSHLRGHISHRSLQRISIWADEAAVMVSLLSRNDKSLLYAHNAWVPRTRMIQLTWTTSPSAPSLSRHPQVLLGSGLVGLAGVIRRQLLL